MRKLTAPSSCEELQKQGISRSQQTYLDGDGQGHGTFPAKGNCIFPEAKTVFGEEKVINITTCGEDPMCFKENLFFETDVLNQINIFMETSYDCSQSWEFDCISAPIRQPVSSKNLLG